MPISAKPSRCWELNNNGTEANGAGPTLAGGSYTAALLSQGLAAGASASVASVPGGITVSNPSTVSGGFWVYVHADSNGAGEGIATLRMDNGGGDFALELALTNSDVDDYSVLTPAGGGSTISLGAVAVGWHHVAFVKNGTTVKTYFDAVEIGSAAYGTSGGSSASVSISSNGYGALIDQPFFHNAAYSEDDIEYIVNGGAGIAFADMSTATVPSAPVLTLDSVGNQQLTLSWTTPADGGSAITQYDLYDDGVLSNDNVTSPHTITGLTNGVESGVWTVKAVNSVGSSAASNGVSGTPVNPVTTPRATSRRRLLMVEGSSWPR